MIAAAQVRDPSGTSRLESFARWLGEPVIAVGRHTAGALGSAVELTSGAVALERDNRRLRREVDLLRTRVGLLEEDVEAFRRAVELVAVYQPERPPVLARTAYRDPAAGRLELRLPPGRRVVRDSAAVAADGVLGRVVAAGHRRSWIQLLRHPAAAVAVRGDRSGIEGLASGTGGDLLLVEFVPRTAPALRGELLRTSGADGVYPPGLPVARITSVEETEGAFLEITAEPVADPGEARVALVVPPWGERPEEDP